MSGLLPKSGEASTYSDYFVGRMTSNGEIYSHEGYTAALLPKSRWYAVSMGTRLRVSYLSRQVVVKVNDRGAGKKFKNGKADERRVLDLSRAAMAYLTGRSASQITDESAGVIQLSNIEIVPPATPLGPIR
jgi:rare lipoprotein A